MPTLQVKTGLKLVLKLPEARDSWTGLGRRFWAVFKGPDGVFFLWSDEEILGCHGLMRFYDVLYGLIWMIMVKITGSMGWNGIYLSIGPILSYPILSYPILSIYIYIYMHATEWLFIWTMAAKPRLVDEFRDWLVVLTNISGWSESIGGILFSSNTAWVWGVFVCLVYACRNRMK